jgi:hypothetical protein
VAPVTADTREPGRMTRPSLDSEPREANLDAPRRHLGVFLLAHKVECGRPDNLMDYFAEAMKALLVARTCRASVSLSAASPLRLVIMLIFEDAHANRSCKVYCECVQ